jgi:hypothetical protein
MDIPARTYSQIKPQSIERQQKPGSRVAGTVLFPIYLISSRSLRPASS